jgi:hypothetical protein
VLVVPWSMARTYRRIYNPSHTTTSSLERIIPFAFCTGEFGTRVHVQNSLLTNTTNLRSIFLGFFLKHVPYRHKGGGAHG